MGLAHQTRLALTHIPLYRPSAMYQVKNIYSETVTLFFVHMVDRAVEKVQPYILYTLVPRLYKLSPDKHTGTAWNI